MCTGLRIVFVHMESDPATVEIFFKKYGLSPVDRFSRPQSRRFILVGSAAGHERRARLLIGNRLTNFRNFLRPRLMRYLTFVIPILSLLFIASCKPEPTEHVPAAWRVAPGFLYRNKIISNSAVWDDQLYVLASSGLCKVQPNGEATCIDYEEKIDFPLPMNRDFFVATKLNPDELVFIPAANPSILEGKRITDSQNPNNSTLFRNQIDFKPSFSSIQT